MISTALNHLAIIYRIFYDLNYFKVTERSLSVDEVHCKLSIRRKYHQIDVNENQLSF